MHFTSDCVAMKDGLAAYFILDGDEKKVRWEKGNPIQQLSFSFRVPREILCLWVSMAKESTYHLC